MGKSGFIATISLCLVDSLGKNLDNGPDPVIFEALSIKTIQATKANIPINLSYFIRDKAIPMTTILPKILSIKEAMGKGICISNITNTVNKIAKT
jgi:hypothetical protein